MQTKHVVVGVVRNKENGKILLMKRSPEKKYFPKKWENAGGYMRKNETPEAAVHRETFEESGLKGKIVRLGRQFEVMVTDLIFVVHPFLIEVQSNKVKMNSEHTDYEWIDVEEHVNFDCVDAIELDYKNLELI